MAAKNLYFVGTAGCGKSTLTYAFQLWMQGRGFDAITVNLDPGVEELMYNPDVAVRDWVEIEDIMKESGLGPNGAQIAAADMMALNIKEISEVVAGFDTDYVLIDTPGQLELFTFRQSSRVIIEDLIPGTMSHIIVIATLSIPGMILAESALSWLGLGLRPPLTSWGVLLQEAATIEAIRFSTWMLWTVLFIIATILAFNMLGDGLRDALDPYSSH